MPREPKKYFKAGTLISESSKTQEKVQRIVKFGRNLMEWLGIQECRCLNKTREDVRRSQGLASKQVYRDKKMGLLSSQICEMEKPAFPAPSHLMFAPAARLLIKRNLNYRFHRGKSPVAISSSFPCCWSAVIRMDAPQSDSRPF